MSLTKATYSMIDGATVNVTDYGAVADWNGTTGTDNTTAFSLAITALASKGGGVLLIPAGQYKGSLIVNQSNICVSGYGATIGYLPVETLTIKATGGAPLLGPFAGFATGSNVPVNPAPNAVFYDVTTATQASRTVTVSNATGIVAGDYCMMISGTSPNSTPITNYIPETCQIRKVVNVSGNDVWFDEVNDATVTSLSEHPYLIKWDFVQNIKIEGLTFNNLYGAAYCTSFGGAVNLTLEKVTFNPLSAWGAFAACRNVRLDNCTINNAYSGFSSGRMCDDVVLIGCTVSCTDTDLSISENYFYFCEENPKNVHIIGCRGVNACLIFYIGNEWTNIQISNSTFDVLKADVSAFRLTTFSAGSLVNCVNSTFVSRGGLSAYPFDVEPNGTIEVAFLAGDILFNGCFIVQAGVGIEIGNQYAGADNVKRIEPVINEQGSWTPIVFGATTPGTTTYTLQEGLYVRQGNLVTIDFSITWSATTATGDIKIGGFPFVAALTNYGVEIVFDGTILVANAIGFLVLGGTATALGFATITSPGALYGKLQYIA